MNAKQRNRLFLICPTDHIQKRVLDNFQGCAFFCSALGVYFEFDEETQYKIAEVVGRKGIDEIIFISDFNNIFYRQTHDHSVFGHYSIREALQKTKEKLSIHLQDPRVFSLNRHLLISNHLKDQRNRLLETSYLGELLEQSNIQVRAYIYYPTEHRFLNLEQLESKGHLLSDIAHN